MAEQSTFGERLAYARWWRAGVIRRESDGEFAELVGITGGALSQWRERADPVDVPKVEKIAELCDVPFDWMLRGDRGDMAAPAHFKKFLEVYREWVTRGGLLKKPPTPAPNTMSAKQRQRELTKPFIFGPGGKKIPLDKVAEELAPFVRKKAPVATGFQKMSSKELEAAKKKPKRRKA